MQQAAAQGQTVISAAGDSGSTSCAGYQDLTETQQEALTVNFPPSSEYVTAIGGTEFPTADVAAGNTYFSKEQSSDVISSALSYIPEQVWNDDSAENGIASGGGGVSVFAPRPSWQTGVPGITTGTFRLVPDISLDSSPFNAPYLFCTSDPSAWAVGQQGSCTSGFRDALSEDLTAAGGTSFAAPIVAAMLAIVNQQQASIGQGNINPTLYTLAGDPATYASVFHDITSGTNECTAGSYYCSVAGLSEYPSGAGCDEASGLGSIDFNKLLNVWPGGSSLDPSVTSLKAATSQPNIGTNDLISVAVAAASGNGPDPSGTVAIAIDGDAATATLNLADGAATYIFNNSTPGAHTVVAIYSGDSTYSPSRRTIIVDPLAPSTTTIVSQFPYPAVSTLDDVTITVAPQSGSGPTPTGSVTVSGTAVTPGTSDLNNGSDLLLDKPTAGTYTATAVYLGDTNYAGSTATINITVVPPTISTSLVLTPANKTTDEGETDPIAIQVVPVTNAATPATGTVAITIDNGPVTSTVPVSNGAATYNFNSKQANGYQIYASYSGDPNYAPSEGATDLEVIPPSFVISLPAIGIKDGGSGSSTVTLTPSGGYSGTVNFTVTGLPADACYSINPLVVTGSAPVTFNPPNSRRQR